MIIALPLDGLNNLTGLEKYNARLRLRVRAKAAWTEFFRSRSSFASTSTLDIPRLPPTAFTFIPDFLSASEQKVLLQTALNELDARESRRWRLRRKDLGSIPPSQNISDIFLPEAYYDFKDGHYDGVIHNYREMHLTVWPSVPGLTSILNRLHSLLPTTVDIQTHLLHLASNGRILPHVDNVEASGTWIFGVSLGSERILRMMGPGNNDNFDVVLPSGSVYLQRDSLRYDYTHSILERGVFNGKFLPGGQRLSVMIRLRIANPWHEINCFRGSTQIQIRPVYDVEVVPR